MVSVTILRFFVILLNCDKYQQIHYHMMDDVDFHLFDHRAVLYFLGIFRKTTSPLYNSYL